MLPLSKLETVKPGGTDDLDGLVSLLRHTLCGFYEQCIRYLAVCLEPRGQLPGFDSGGRHMQDKEKVGPTQARVKDE